jgi:hypothetical protein
MMAALPTEPNDLPAVHVDQSWHYPGALRLTLRRALAVTHTDPTISEEERARWMTAYQDMWDILKKAERGRGRPTLEEELAGADGDKKRRNFANRFDDAWWRLRCRGIRLPGKKAMAHEMGMGLNSFKAWLDACGYGQDARHW